MKLIDKLPTSYEQINYKDYIKIINSIPNECPDEWDEEEYNVVLQLAPLSILLDMPIAELERMPAGELLPLLERINFMSEDIKTNAKLNFNLRTIEELTYDQFVSYQTLRLDQWANMPRILNILIKDLTPEQIDNLNIREVCSIFFMVNKQTKAYLQSSIISLGVKLMKQGMNQIMKKMLNPFRKG